MLAIAESPTSVELELDEFLASDPAPSVPELDPDAALLLHFYTPATSPKYHS